MDSPPNDSHTLNQAKGRRGPSSSSCAECKRLKIRCTGTTKGFPCASCDRRGVAAICPNGVMPERQRRSKDSGDSDLLRRRNQQLAARVKELEEALAKATGATPGSTTTSDSRKTDDEDTVYSKEDDGLVESFGTLTIEETGRTVWHGPYTPAFNLIPADDYNIPAVPEHLIDESLPPELMLLAAGFPLTRPGGLHGAKDAIRRLMPTYDEAAMLADHFFASAGWLGSAYSKEEFFRDILLKVYAKNNWETVPSDLVALICGLLAVGCVFDLSRELYDPLGFRLQKLCAAALALAKPIDQPTITSLEAMQFHLFFYQLSDTPISLARYWALSAIAFRMAQALGLHRDSSACGLDPALEQKRRALFWHLNFMDGVLSASYGRPRYFNSRQYDCPIPEESSMSGISKISIYRFEFIRDALLPVLEEGFAVTPPPTYATVMRLDQKIRNLPILDPEKLGVNLMALTAAECMQFFCIGGMRELVLLYLHRRYLFIVASDEKSEDMTKHKFGYSVIAGYTAAVGMIRQLRGLFFKDPAFATRLFFLWLHGFSAFIVMATIVIKRPASEFAESAMNEMESVISIFLQAQSSRRVQRCLPSMMTLKEKARAILALHKTGQKIKVPPDAQLERLLGGVPVVLKNASKLSCGPGSPSPSETRGNAPQAFSPYSPPQQQNVSELDLQALLGFPENALNFGMYNAQPGTQADSFDWNVPVETPLTEVINANDDQMNDILSSLFQGDPGLFAMDGNPTWDSMVPNFS